MGDWDVPFLDLSTQYRQIQSDVDKAVFDVIKSCRFIGGPDIRRFEASFAAYQQAKHCVGVGNGTDALEIAIEALGLQEGEILVPANSFISSSEAVTRSGHRVVFCDVEPDFYGISLSDAKDRISATTVAILPVHLYGQPCDMSAIRRLAEENSLAVIEDCAQAHGAEWEGRRVGTLGDVGTFSFYPGKNLGAYGDAGAIVTNNGELADRCRRIANHGRTAKYDHAMEGRNSRLDGIQAAVLSVKLSHLEGWIEKRRVIAERYLDGLKDLSELAMPQRRVGARHVYHLFVVHTSARDELRRSLDARKIQTGIHYPQALPDLSAYEYLDEDYSQLNARQLAASCLSLPMGEHLTLEQADQVIDGVRMFFR